MANMATEKNAAGFAAGDLKDANELFEKYTIEEIRNREIKIRGEIEKKKEDLRVMVGERYRDLIEAADTITAMKNSAEKVMKSISHMEELCQTLQQNRLAKVVSVQQPQKLDQVKKKRESEFLGVASQIKLLLDMPEKIWSSVDGGDYLTGTQLYLLARHINTSLHLHSQHSSQVLSWFPVLSRQWAAISHFKTTILQGCRSLLSDTEKVFTDQQMAEILCSILLLDDSSPRQVFNEFLLARTKALQQTLQWGQQGNVKEQVCSVVHLMTSTVHQIRAIFFDPGKEKEHRGHSNMLLETVQRVINCCTLENAFGLEDMQGSVSMKCLPKSVLEFHPNLRAAVASISVDSLQTNCQQWINTCLQDVRSGVGKLLNYVTSVKRLADIRDAVWNILAQTGDKVAWTETCQEVINKDVLVWQDFLQPLFVDRIKALIQQQLESTAEMTKRSLSKFMMELASEIKDSNMIYEVDLGQFLWSEAAGDIQMNYVWRPAANRPVAESGGLVFKARTFTPAVYSLCQNMDGRLKALLEDSQAYLQPPRDTAATANSASGSSRSEDGPFDCYANTADILHFCQVACSKAVTEITDYMHEQLTLWEKSLKEIPDPDTQTSTKTKILLVARMCSAFCELTPNLQLCILWASEHQRQDLAGRKFRSQQKIQESPEWQAVVTRLEQCRLKAYRIWVDHTVSKIIASFTHCVVDKGYHTIIEKATKWEETEITEETEEGKKHSSKIQVPSQASWYVQSALFELCQCFNKVGAHAFPRLVLKDMLVRVLQGMLGAYEQLLANRGKGSKSSLPLSQQEALQAAFNAKYILHVIPWREDSEVCKAFHKKSQTVIEGLEGHVDPFDLDVFFPYMQSNMMKATQRSAVLLGALSLSDRHAMLSAGRPIMSSQDQHNIMALTSCAARFPLLPLGTQPSSRLTLQQAVLSQTVIRSFDMGAGALSLTSIVEATLPKISSQSDLSTSFYDKLDKLGSMGSKFFSNIGGKS